MNRQLDVNKLLRWSWVPAAVLTAFIVGFGLRGAGPVHEHAAVPVEETANAEVLYWTCAMHPQIRQPKPGKCPICGMDLIPVISDRGIGELGPREIRLSPQALILAEVQVAPVERKPLEKEVRLVGKVDYDETRRKSITAWLPGRIDSVYVDFTGTTVRKGEPLVSVYSPELLATQEEFIQAIRAERELEASPLETMRETALRTVESSRGKLRLLGLSPEQIARIELDGTPTEHITIYSPLGGVVIEKNALEGMYVQTGMPLYAIADLSSVWVMLDVYEADLQWLRLGQRVAFTSDAWPGETFTGTVSFIDPVLNDTTRTVNVRVSVPNPKGKLKPDMFVRSVLHSVIGKTAQDLPLVIPASAPLVTGKRAVVYVASAGKEGIYEGREVVLGTRAGEYYEVKQGLAEGEMVVVNGAFKIDSAVQILAKPSMMNPEGGVAPAVHNHGGTPAPAADPHAGHTAAVESEPAPQEHGGHGVSVSGYNTGAVARPDEVPQAFKVQLDRLYSMYFTIQDALSRDSLADARNAAGNLVKEVAKAEMKLLKGEAHDAWMRESESIRESAGTIAAAQNLDAAREAFLHLSLTTIGIADTFGVSGNIPVYRFHCPMADDNRGADWLQNEPIVHNPYLGSAMVSCGELTDTLSTGKVGREER